MSNTALNRTTIVQLTNQSGSDLSQGTIVIVDTANDKAFTTTTTSGYATTNVGVIFEPFAIAAGETGGVALAGWVPTVLVSGEHNAGSFVRASDTAGYAIPFTSAGAGDFGILLQNDTNPEAFLFGNTVQSVGGSSGPSASEVLYADTDTTDVVNTTTETTLYDYTIDSSNCTAKNFFTVKSHGYIFNNTGSDQTFTFKLSSNGTTIVTCTLTNFPSGTGFSLYKLEYDCIITTNSGGVANIYLLGNLLANHRDSQQINSTRNFMVPFATVQSVSTTPDITIKATITHSAMASTMELEQDSVIIRGPFAG